MSVKGRGITKTMTDVDCINNSLKFLRVSIANKCVDASDHMLACKFLVEK